MGKKASPLSSVRTYVWASVRNWYFLHIQTKMKSCLTEYELRQKWEDRWQHWKNHTLTTQLEMSWQTGWERILAKFRETSTSTEIHTYCQLAACTWQTRPRVKIKIDGSEWTVKAGISLRWMRNLSQWQNYSHVDSLSHGVLSLLKSRRLIPTVTCLLDTRHIQICNRSGRLFILEFSSPAWTFLVSIMGVLSPMRSQLSQNLEDRPPVHLNR